MRLRAFLSGFFGVLILMGLVSAGTVWAHAKLLRAEPAPGSVVNAAPRVVRTWFTDELEPHRSAISVWDGHGRRADDGKGGVDLNDLDRKSMIAQLKPLSPGTYSVKWTAVSADDLNVATGTFRFTVRPGR